MRIKVVVSVLAVLGVLLMLGFPVIYRTHPGDGAPPRELAIFGTRMLAYFGITCVVWLAAAMASIFLVRQARKDFLEMEARNLQELVEGSLRDHQKDEGQA